MENALIDCALCINYIDGVGLRIMLTGTNSEYNCLP